MTNPSKWQDDFPKEVGLWWFYGWRFGREKRLLSNEYEKPELCLVEVGQASNALMYTTRGHFMYAKEGAVGKWLKATLPELPAISAAYLKSITEPPKKRD